MRKYQPDVTHAEAGIIYQILEFPLLISRVQQEVMILFVSHVAACPAGFYGEGCNRNCSCRNDGICHPASGQCACTPGWTGPNCTKGEFIHQREVITCTTGKEQVTRCLFLGCFSQSALLGFMEQTVSSDACARMEPLVIRPVENVHAPAAGQAQPVNWVRLKDGVSKSLHVLPLKHSHMDQEKKLIYCNLSLIFVLLAVANRKRRTPC